MYSYQGKTPAEMAQMPTDRETLISKIHEFSWNLLVQQPHMKRHGMTQKEIDLFVNQAITEFLEIHT